MLITDAGDGYVYVEFPASELVGRQKSGEFITYSDKNGIKTLRRLLYVNEVEGFVKRRCPALLEAVTRDKTLQKIKSALAEKTTT
ncbi:hypothetical protein [uncultured Mesotoga sp.]|uniref:hypothetical protein n=1 Tax=uncultured Mesotoga sp. TaxID=1184400 RepID=UPI001BD429E4|nr:hypothetical protein [uncultured Mesotoga sp.]